MQLHPINKLALEKINFLSRFKRVTERYSNKSQNRLELKESEVLHLINNLGYEVKFDKREHFFEIKESVDRYEFQLNISLKYNKVEPILGIKKDDIRLTIGGPWGFICDLLANDDSGVFSPFYNNITDLEMILIEVFKIFEDFKIAILSCDSGELI